MNKEDSTIMKILTFEDTTGNDKLDSQLDDTATLLLERGTRYISLKEIEEKLTKGIYGDL